MNESSKSDDRPDMKNRASDSGEFVAGLLRLAGPRADAPYEMTRRVRETVLEAWVREVASRRRKRRWLWMAGTLAAASALVLVGAVMSLRQEVGHGAGPAATLLLAPGGVRGADGALVYPAGDLGPGSPLETGTGARAAFRLAGGAIVRMDVATRIVLKGPAGLTLDRGAVYIDSGASAPGGRLVIETRAGILRDVGTRFEVRVQNDEVTVRVREGSVRLDAANRFDTIPALTGLRIDASGLGHSIDLHADDPAWRWILEVSPPFEMEGRTLGEFLDWVSTETGQDVRFAVPSKESQARTIVLHGSVAGIRPDLAADVVLPACGLSHRVEGNTLVIGNDGIPKAP